MKDEGTPFALVNSLNTTTTEQFKDYFRRMWWPMATSDQIDCLAELYPNDPSAGSPFDTGNANAINPQYKRLAALIGDYSFESQCRQLLSQTSGPKWTYQVVNNLGELGLDVPVLGSFHASDVSSQF